MTAFALALAGLVLDGIAVATWRAGRARPRLLAWRMRLLDGACALTGISGALDGRWWLTALCGVLLAAWGAAALAARRARRRLAAVRAMLADLAEGSPE